MEKLLIETAIEILKKAKAIHWKRNCHNSWRDDNLTDLKEAIELLESINLDAIDSEDEE